jgi:hypothetical protein
MPHENNHVHFEEEKQFSNSLEGGAVRPRNSFKEEEKMSNPLKLNVINVLKIPVVDPKDLDQDQSKRV